VWHPPFRRGDRAHGRGTRESGRRRERRPYLVYDVRLGHVRIGNFDVGLVRDYLQALATQVGMNLH